MEIPKDIKILIADDHPETLTQIREEFKKLDMTNIIEAKDGHETLKRIQEQEDQGKLSKSCVENNTLPIPYKLPELVEISYAYLFQVCEKGFEFAESLAPITGASNFTSIYVASNKTLEHLNSDIFSKITAHIEENLPAILALNETKYKIDAQFQNESDECTISR